MVRERDSISNIIKGWPGIAGAKLGSINCFFILCLIFHGIDVLTNFRELSLRIFLYILLLVFGWLTVFKKEQGVIDVADLKMPIILSTLAFFIPYLGNIIPFFAVSQTFHTIIIFLPVWVIYTGFAMQETKFIVFFRWVLIFFWLVLFLPSIFINISTDFHIRDIESTVNVQQTIVDAVRDFGSNFKRFWKNVLDFPTMIGTEVGHMIKYATGDYYTGDVDEYEKEPIGVYLEDLEATDSVFFQGENITVWGTLRAKTLNDEINVNLSCYAKEGNKKVMGKIIPTKLNIYDEETEDISCVFSDLNVGNNNVVFNAEFNFETMAYLKLYFINRETLRSFNRDNIDVFNFYGINHINPVAVYTNGPIRIGMGIKKELPIGVYTDKENTPFSLGITLQNDWDGIIKNVTELNIYVHDSMELTRCDHEVENKGHVDEEQANYNVYSLVVPNRRTQNISDYETITCSVNAIDPESLLGSESIITRYFRVSTKYIYELKKSTLVEVEETEGYEEAPGIDELKEMKDSEKIKKECDSIESCDDYNNEEEYYDMYGFSIRTWCEADPCDKNCYWNEIKMKCMEKEEKIPITGEWRDYDESEVELKIRGAAEEYGFPEKVLLGIAETENEGLKHIDDEGNVEENKGTGCIGVMQIRTDNNWCSLCSKTKEELKDINTNIECGVRIFKSKYNTFCDNEGNIKKKNDGTTIFESSVRKNCFNDEYIKKYLTYEGNCEDMAIRYYNGLGCKPPSEYGYAEINYVEMVRENMKKFN